MNENKEIDQVDEIKKLEDIPSRLPVLPLRDSLVFPYMLFPILVGREQSVEAVEYASKNHKFVLLIAQKDSATEEPTNDGLYRVGTVARILQVLKLPNGLLKVLVDGVAQGFVKKLFDENQILHAEYSINFQPLKKDTELDAYVKHATQLFRDYVRNSRDLPPETIMSFENIEQADRKFYYILANLDLPIPEKMELFSMKSLREQYEDMIRIMTESWRWPGFRALPWKWSRTTWRRWRSASRSPGPARPPRAGPARPTFLISSSPRSVQSCRFWRSIRSVYSWKVCEALLPHGVLQLGDGLRD